MAGQRTVDWHNRAQLLAIAARMMRRILLDRAALRHASKRAGDEIRVELHDDLLAGCASAMDVLELDHALDRLEAIDSQQASIVELRFYGGLKNEEIAEVLGVSTTTVRRRWASARLWLVRELAGEESP